VIVRLPLEYQKNYTVNIAAGLKDLYGRALGKAEKVEAKVGEAGSYVYIHNPGARILEAGFPPKIVWEAQNPVSLRNQIAAAQGPYERLPLTGLTAMDLSTIPPNSKRYFVEDLSPFLNAAGKGAAALRWEYRTRSSWDPGRIDTSDAWLTVQVTNIGITVRYAYNMALVWATHLSDGTAAANANVELLEGENVILSGKTDAQGLAVFQFSNSDFVSRFTEPYNSNWDKETVGRGLRIRVIEGQGNTKDQAEFIPNDSHNLWRGGVQTMVSPFKAEQERPVIFLFTDRGLYRPGETVVFRGIDRILRQGNFEAYQGPYQIEVTTGSYRRNPVAIVSLNGGTTANGGSYGSFTLPADADPGQYRLVYRRGKIENTISFTVAHFERLRFESSLRFSDPVVYQGEKLSASLSASYLAGGGLSGAPYTWHLTREPAGFVPGGVDGAWRYWRFGPEVSDGRGYMGRGQGTLGPDGKAGISYETSSEGVEGAIYRYRLEAAVQDAARQEVAANAAILVHPASFYIAARIDSGTIKNADGAKPSAYFLSAGKPATLSWALVSPEGEAWRNQNAGELSIQLVRHEWKQARHIETGGRVSPEWERTEEIVEERAVKGEHAGVFHFTPEKSGSWEIRLKSRDLKQRVAATGFRFYVSGAGWVRWGPDNADAITLTADRPSYRPGETAQILVRTPLEKGTYLLTLEREGIISRRIIELEGSALTIDIPIEESYIPIVYVALSSYTVRSGPPQNTYYEADADRPKGVFGVTPIFVDHESRHYQVEIIGNKNTYRPAEEAEIKIKVLLNGKAVPNAELSFMAVDRGVTDLIDYHVPDPAAFFYDPHNFPLGVRGGDNRSLLIDPVINLYFRGDGEWSGTGFNGEARMMEAGFMAKSTSMENESPLEERKDFRATAVFEPFLVTGADGTATVKFKLPDSLTTYRCTAIAAGVRNFGMKEQDLRASAPLTATAALPRKLRWRDTGTVSLILTNLENTSVEANVSLAIDTALEVDGENSKNVKIPPGASREVTFKVAALGTGEAQLAFTLRSPQVNERIIKTLRVDRPSLTETVTTIGNLGGGDSFAEEGMVLPSLVPEGTGNVTISLSASRLAALKETLGYLLDYPYGCIEQRTARLFPLIIFGDHLDSFGLTTSLRVEDELADLAKFQLGDGSFSYWPGGTRGDIFVSLRAAHIAALAKAKGMKMPEAFNERQLLSWIAAARVDPKDYFLKGYALWVRAMYGEKIGSEISAFLRQGDELGISGWAFAGLAALEMGQRDLAVSTRDRVRRYIRPGTRSLDLTDTYERRDNYWGYDSDRYALALMLFHALDPDDDQAGLLASSLIARQRQGIWNNTASSFWAALAFGMLSEMESADTAVNASVTLGGASLFNAELKSYGGAPVSYNGAFTEKPLIDLTRDTLLPLRIERLPLVNGDGEAGRLYYTASLRYGIPAELAGARDEGMGVFAETFDSDGQPITNGKLIPGKTYTRRITVSSSRDRTYVALRAPIPSGAEIVDAAFVTSSTVPPPAEKTADRQDYWSPYFYQPSPVRFIMDDEVRFHWDFFRTGRQQVEFRFRAVMPGIYPTPPASAECMYEPEIFGRSAGELIRIE
jgi:uncharacterized protein YfaS (alpha-2-macroglobulin family)